MAGYQLLLMEWVFGGLIFNRFWQVIGFDRIGSERADCIQIYVLFKNKD